MMLSRVAENLYWMARYLERAENSARLINVNTNLQLDLPKAVRPGWGPLIEMMGNESLFRNHYSETDEASVVRFLIGDHRNPGAILPSLSNAREDARTVRDYMPREIWELVNALFLNAKSNLSAGLSNRRRFDYLRDVILGVQQITGLLSGSMTHDEGYQFLRLGRNLERGDMTIRIIDVSSANLLPEVSEDLAPFRNIQWMSVLKSLSAYQMYRRAMQVRVRRPDVLKFLFKERLFPRAFYHTVCEVEECLKGLPRSSAPLEQVDALKEAITGAHPDKMNQSTLHKYIDGLEKDIIDIHNSLSTTYFLHNGAGAAGTR